MNVLKNTIFIFAIHLYVVTSIEEQWFMVQTGIQKGCTQANKR